MWTGLLVARLLGSVGSGGPGNRGATVVSRGTGHRIPSGVVGGVIHPQNLPIPLQNVLNSLSIK